MLASLVFFVFAQGWASAFGRGWNLNLLGSVDPLRRNTIIDGAKLSATDDFHYEAPFHYSCEVVGAFGRVGSFWLCHGHGADTSTGASSGDLLSTAAAAAVPRGVSPGCLTASGCPIYVATPSSAWPEIWNQTLEDRREDLVFVGNGLPPPHWEGVATLVVPHFAVFKRCRLNTSDGSPCLQTSPVSPRTVVYGKHALEVARILNSHGVETKVIESFPDIKEAAARKLLWASCMWLVCRAEVEATVVLTVEQVHAQRQSSLDALVEELYPALVTMVGRPVDRKNLDNYLRDYSMSIGGAIPSKDLAISEIEGRNGLWLSMKNDKHPQKLHQELIRAIAGEELLKIALSQTSASSLAAPPKIRSNACRMRLVFWGDRDPSQLDLKTVVIVGGGMIGSSLAHFLAERRPDLIITVLDQLPPESVGETTPASWAWLNANGKSPKTYQILNQLGIHVWKHEPLLSQLASWTGSLVRFADPPEFVNDGGYPVEGPLAHSRLRELEPLANWTLSTDNGIPTSAEYTYLFRDEGCVDPLLAVQTLRQVAMEKGVNFVGDAKVTSITRDSISGRVCGVAVKLKQKDILVAADLVVVAAGAGSGAKALGTQLHLLHSPGAIAYAKPAEKARCRLSRILVDPLRSSHVLQRPDGSIVAGGGELVFGGAAGTVASASTNHTENLSLFDGAKSLAPQLLEGSKWTHTCEAIRPMPQDGLPIVGYIEANLYVVVTHSGMTLGPLLASIAASEISDGASCDLVAPYRPSRFGV